MDSIKADIIKWNRDRGLLEKGFDPLLELQMLSEEAREFYLADTFEQQLAEYADFLFVKYGSVAKYGATKIRSVALFEIQREGYIVFLEWTEEMIGEMYDLLESEYTRLYEKLKIKRNLGRLIEFALETVRYCNSFKGKKTKDGKVQKNDKHIDPKIIIKEYICKLM